MAFIQIPTTSDFDNYTETVDIDGVSYILKFKFNNRQNVWTLEIYDTDENHIVSTRVLVGKVFLNRFVLETLPQQNMICINIDGTLNDPGSDSLGTTHEVIYGTFEE